MFPPKALELVPVNVVARIPPFNLALHPSQIVGLLQFLWVREGEKVGRLVSIMTTVVPAQRELGCPPWLMMMRILKMRKRGVEIACSSQPEINTYVDSTTSWVDI